MPSVQNIGMVLASCPKILRHDDLKLVYTHMKNYSPDKKITLIEIYIYIYIYIYIAINKSIKFCCYTVFHVLNIHQTTLFMNYIIEYHKFYYTFIIQGTLAITRNLRI